MAIAVSFGEILPLAFVMIAGPQIVTSFFLATSGRWAANSIAYLGGAAISVTTTVTVAYFVAKGVDHSAGGHKAAVDRGIDGIVLVLMLFLIVRVYLNRGKSEPPKWMSRLQTAEPKFALLIGLALMGVFPTDIASSVAAGFHVERSGDPWWQCLPFVALTLLLLAIPALCVVFLGRRAGAVLPKIRDWMNSHSWVISEIVLVFFAAIAIKGLIEG
ncbi:GAP family protein [Streptomyces sp. B8F3]|uniref:GAP family protein n=1 Tax=unclassified Streptomyces TaxID=2593676 RepID=UPI00325D5426